MALGNPLERAAAWRYRVRMVAGHASKLWHREIARLRRVVRSVFRPAHLLVVVKSAVIATAAWFVGIHLPGDMAEYAYYAPLGVLVAMTPTVASSVWSSVLAVLGVLIGLAIAWSLIFTGVHGIVALFGAIALASLVSGAHALGPGRSYIPFAAAFVFLTGGGETEEFSLGLTLQFSLGAALGVAVNLLIPPPLNVHSVRNHVAQLRRSLGLCLSKFGEWVASEDPEGSASEWLWLLDDTERLRADTGGFLEHADKNKRGNLRARFADTNLSHEHDTMNAMRQCITELYRVSDLPDELSSQSDEAEESGEGVGGDAGTRVIPLDIAQPLAQACVALALTLGVEEHELLQEPGNDSALEHVDRAHDSLAQATDLSPAITEWMFVVVFAMRRITVRLSHLEASAASP